MYSVSYLCEPFANCTEMMTCPRCVTVRMTVATGWMSPGTSVDTTSVSRRTGDVTRSESFISALKIALISAFISALIDSLLSALISALLVVLLSAL